MVGNDERFGLLSRRRRLVALSVLKDRDEPMTPAELATEVGVRELGVSPEELTDDQRERILTSFHHVHFPKLTNADLLEHTPSGDAVRLSPEPDVQRIVDAVFED